MTTKIPSAREWMKEHSDDAARRSERAEDVSLKIEANEIARRAVRTNKYLSIGALIVSILSLIVAIVAIAPQMDYLWAVEEHIH